jgi:hypothetical protein
VLYPLSYEGRGLVEYLTNTLRVGSLYEFQRCSARPSAISGGWPAPGLRGVTGVSVAVAGPLCDARAGVFGVRLPHRSRPVGCGLNCILGRWQRVITGAAKPTAAAVPRARPRSCRPIPKYRAAVADRRGCPR